MVSETFSIHKARGHTPYQQSMRPMERMTKVQMAEMVHLMTRMTMILQLHQN